MFEYILEKTQNVDLTDELKKQVAEHVGQLFSDWDNVRDKQKNIAEKLHSELYLDERINQYRDADDEWKSDIHLNKLYSLFQTQQAYIWDNIYSRIENMFDVDGLDEKSAQSAPKQKQKLVSTLYKINIQRKLDKAIEHLGSIGESCLFIGWRRKVKQVRRLLKNVSPNLKHMETQQNVFGVYNQEIYNGANVEAINPLNLVFDPRICPEDTEKWDACGKIIKSWENYISIRDNKLYSLSPSQYEEIKKLLCRENVNKNEYETLKLHDIIDGNRIEVLQYWGDYVMPDGTVLKNWHIVIIGRKYVACFEPNRWVINPIINIAVFRDVKSQRGIPELWSIYDLCKEQENKVNLQNDAQALNLNPPAYAPEGFFKDKVIRLYPGKQVEYKPGLEDPSAIIKMNFPLLYNESIIQYYDTTASAVSGIFPNMQGQQEYRPITATEINVKMQGQTTRLGKLLDTLKQNLIVPMIQKIAELEANMKFGEEKIYLNQAGKIINQNIDDDVRQGYYEYRYTDNAGILKKMEQNQTLIQLLMPLWNDKDIPFNKIEIVKKALNNIGIENTDKYITENIKDSSSGSYNEQFSKPQNTNSEAFNLPIFLSGIGK